MTTFYNKENAGFSTYAHKFAKRDIYPILFPGCKIEVDHVDGSIDDLEDKIDVYVKVAKEGFKQEFVFAIQERWRKPQFSRYRDITLTEYNHDTKKPVEFYNGKMQFFLYGYFDPEKERFGEVVFIDVAALRHKICTGEIDYQINYNDKNQSFACFKFDHLSVTGCIEWSNSKMMPSHDMPAEYFRYLLLESKK